MNLPTAYNRLLIVLPLFLLLLFSSEAIRRVARLSGVEESLLHEGEHKWRMRLSDGDGRRELGVKTLRIEAITEDDRPCWRLTIVRDIVSRETALTDTLLLDRATSRVTTHSASCSEA